METIASSSYRILNRFSTPSVKGYGVEKLFSQSDQHEYMFKCTHCGFWNLLEYEEYDPSSIHAGGNIRTVNPAGVDRLAKTVVDGSFQYVCKKCGQPLDRWTATQQYVPRYPSRTADGGGIRGYAISQLDAVWISADDIKRKELASESKQLFYNYTLGFSYENEGLMVQPEDVYGNTYNETNPVLNRDDYRFISIGIDWGKNHWLTVYGVTNSGEEHILNFTSVEKPGTTDLANMGADIEQIKLFISKYNPDIIVADVGDSGDKVTQLMEYFGEDRVYGCRYKSSPRSTGQIIPQWSEQTNIVTVDKLMQNKRYISKLKGGEIKHYRNANERNLNLYLEHWRNVVIRDEEDTRNGGTYETIIRRGDDHYSQASVYAMLGAERLMKLRNDDGDTSYTTAIDTEYRDLPDIYLN